MDQGLGCAELSGLFLSLVGYICSLVAILSPQWLTFSAGLLVNENYLLGLWETCVIQDMGASVCKGFDSLLDLSADLQITRILMCLSVAVSSLGFGFCIPSLTCVKIHLHGGSSVKRKMTILGGSLLFAGGILTLAPVSYMAHITLVQFWDSNMPDIKPRWEYGGAMFCGWAGGLLLLAGSILLIKSKHCIGQRPRRFSIKAVGSRQTFFDKMEYV